MRFFYFGLFLVYWVKLNKFISIKFWFIFSDNCHCCVVSYSYEIISMHLMNSKEFIEFLIKKYSTFWCLSDNVLFFLAHNKFSPILKYRKWLSLVILFVGINFVILCKLHIVENECLSIQSLMNQIFFFATN